MSKHIRVNFKSQNNRGLERDNCQAIEVWKYNDNTFTVSIKNHDGRAEAFIIPVSQIDFVEIDDVEVSA